jgi:hypothetical protein
MTIDPFDGEFGGRGGGPTPFWRPRSAISSILVLCKQNKTKVKKNFNPKINIVCQKRKSSSLKIVGSRLERFFELVEIVFIFKTHQATRGVVIRAIRTGSCFVAKNLNKSYHFISLVIKDLGSMLELQFCDFCRFSVKILLPIISAKNL